MTQLVGIFGYPLAHSISPAIHQAAIDYCSLALRYLAWPTPPERLEGEVRKLRGDEYLGANVTVPHKETVGAHLDNIDTWASKVGAVNTIVRKHRQLSGYNTDTYGFIESLKRSAGFDPRGARVLLLGAGGAARAAVFGLAQEGIASLAIANRTLRRAESLADNIRGGITHVSTTPMSGAAFEEACAGAELIVNATSIGMRGGEAAGRTPLEAGLIPAGALVYDMVYNPPETPLLAEASKAGARTLGGLPMLIYQGAASFERWTGKDAPVEVMFQAGQEALAALSAAH
jgi:shikimate dehydrogenase